MNRLAAEARRLSLGISNGHSNNNTDNNVVNNRSSRGPSESRSESTPNSRKSSSSENGHTGTCSIHNGHGHGHGHGHGTGNGTATPPKRIVNGVQRRPSDIPVFSRRTSENVGIGGNNRRSSNASTTDSVIRKPSSEMDASELQQRRLSEAGLRRSSTSDVVLNENTTSLMVGMRVYVDGTKPGQCSPGFS